MFAQILETSCNSQRIVQPTTFRFRNPKNKKYVLHKMITKQQKQILTQLKNRAKKKDPQYFSRMLKQQKKKILVNTFIKKLKNSIILSQPPFQSTDCQEISLQQFQCVQISKNLKILISIFFLFQLILLIIFNSLALIFQEFSQSDLLVGYNIFSIIIHIFQVGLNLFTKYDQQQHKKQTIKQNLNNYLFSQKFLIDVSVFIAFIIILIGKGPNTFHQSILIIAQFIILLKNTTLRKCLSYLELVLIQNEYRQEIWNLIKVFLLNFIIAHCISIVLIAMTRLNPQQNWINKKQLSGASQRQLYVWSYYWATTIMLTVGFGDICPTNQTEALCMIFIQILSCIVLAYNINRVGAIISKIRAHDLQKISNLKVLQHISQNSKINVQIQDKLTNYIRQSTLIKRNYNIQQQKKFIQKLPLSFKQDLLKQMNKNIWTGLPFFRNFSQKTILQLSKNIQKKLTHPQQIVYSAGKDVDIMIFNNGTFGLSYNNGKAKCNGKIMQKFYVKQNQFKIASLDFLLSRTMNYDIKCVDYMIFYKISLNQYLSILQTYSFDYEYFFMVKDKDKFLLNEFEIEKCKICQNQRHSSFKCPRLHYIPIKKHIIDKYINQHKKKILNFYVLKFLQRNKIKSRNSLRYKKYVKKEMMQIRLRLKQFGTQQTVQAYKLSCIDLNFESNEYQSYNDYVDQIIRGQSKEVQNLFNKPLIKLAVDRIREDMKTLQQIKNLSIGQNVWDLQCDLAHNYKFYFKNQNAEDLDKRLMRKAKRKLSFLS